MESHAKLAGHPIHPMLIVFPLGLLISSLIFDIIGLASRNSNWSIAAFFMMAGGIVSGLVAAVFGIVDWLAIPKNTRARVIGAWHGVGNVVVIGLFAIAWGLRFNNPEQTVGASLPLMIIAVAMALVTGWLGGELVDRLGIGVYEGANPNSSSSLSGR